MSLSEVVRCFRRQHLRAATLLAVAVLALASALTVRHSGDVLLAVSIYLAGFAVAMFAIKVELGVAHAVQTENLRYRQESARD